MVAMNPEDYGFTRVALPEEQTFDVVEIKGSVALSELAKLAGITTEELRTMNPELLRWATPPGPRPYPLKIPVGRKDGFVQEFEAIAATAVNDITIHTVKRGESLGIIANKYSITVRELMAANEGLRSTIQPGQTITVPVPGAGNVAISADSPSRARTAAVSSTTTSSRAAATRSTYRVRSGDSLWEIAKRHNMTVNQLKQMNNLRSNTVRPGQVLRVSRRGS
jgi:membrane-bound lytic murein transglycosylase D